MKYSKYKQSRDLAWQILLSHNVTELPVKIYRICTQMGVETVSYKNIDMYVDEFELKENMLNNDGFTLNNIIFYNDKCSVQRQRFTIAHELGHILLHTESIYNREPSANDNPIEHDANVFASRLLAPACVLCGLGVATAEQIALICDISLTAAKFRSERMNLLNKRNMYFTSPLERQVYEQFKDYIEKNKL